MRGSAKDEQPDQGRAPFRVPAKPFAAGPFGSRIVLFSSESEARVFEELAPSELGWS